MPVWHVVDYVSDEEGNLIRNWCATQDHAVVARFEATLITLAGIEVWDDPELEQFKVLTGPHVGLGEIRFEVEQQVGTKRKKRKFRMLGIWPPPIEREFVMLGGLEKSGRSPTPTNAFELAMKYKADFERDEGRTCDHFEDHFE